MRRRLALVLALAAGTLALTAGCSTCATTCFTDAVPLEFVGELLELDDSIATFAGPDGPVEILVLEKARFLDEGSIYAVTANRAFGEAVEWETQIASDCGCEFGIRHEDGGLIDTGWWTGLNRTLPVTAWTFLLLVIPIITLAGVTISRMRRGADHDPYPDLPDDGSWHEYDGFVDESGDPA